MKWSKQTWKAALPVYNSILEHPFVLELMDGSLEKEKFMFYIQQDVFYLGEFGKVLAGIASRAGKPEYTESFLHFAKDTIQVERALHQSFFNTIGVTATKEPSPTCLFYISYMQRQLINASLEVAMATVLPCFWIYREVGDYIIANQKKNENPYQNWIDTYVGEEYSKAVDKAVSICDEMAEACSQGQRQLMTDAFVMCSKMEWMFWDSAWRLEKWPI
jgi:thiaminase/transcriptional activator TenA